LGIWGSKKLIILWNQNSLYSFTDDFTSESK
jgi:hypothetical protein